MQTKPPTLNLNENELIDLLSKGLEEASKFTIPMLITSLQKTIDKNGGDAVVLDVIINSDLYINKIIKGNVYKTFMISVALQMIENEKYYGEIDKDNYVILKNKKYQEPFVSQLNEVKNLLSDFDSSQTSAHDKMNDFLNIIGVHHDNDSDAHDDNCIEMVKSAQQETSGSTTKKVLIKEVAQKETETTIK